MFKVVFIVAVLVAIASAVPARQYEEVSQIVLAEDHSSLHFNAGGYTWQLALEQAAATEAGQGHYQGVLEGDHESVAHVNVYETGHFDAIVKAGGDYYFVDYEAAEDRYVMVKEEDFDVAALAAKMPELAEPLAAPALREGEATAPVERPSVYKVAAWYDTATPSFVGSDPAALVRGMFSSINTIVMAPKNLPRFQVTIMGGLRGRGVQTDRGACHDWFTNYVKGRSSQLGGYNIYSWSVAVNFGGRAYRGTACDSRYPIYYKTGVSGMPIWSGNRWHRAYALRTLAHECGHNLGCPHRFGSKSIMDYNWPQGSFNNQVGYFSNEDVANMRSAGCA